jgi:hypothetical protein
LSTRQDAANKGVIAVWFETPSAHFQRLLSALHSAEVKRQIEPIRTCFEV